MLSCSKTDLSLYIVAASGSDKAVVASLCIFINSQTFAVVNWGLQKGSKRAFRPAMALSTGELSCLGGKLLLMTATATKKTMRVLTDQFPEISKWELILRPPARKNVTILVPPVDIISSKFETTLAPFIEDMKMENKTYLILVRGMSLVVCF